MENVRKVKYNAEKQKTNKLALALLYGGRIKDVFAVALKFLHFQHFVISGTLQCPFSGLEGRAGLVSRLISPESH